MTSGTLYLQRTKDGELIGKAVTIEEFQYGFQDSSDGKTAVVKSLNPDLDLRSAMTQLSS